MPPMTRPITVHTCYRITINQTSADQTSRTKIQRHVLVIIIVILTFEPGIHILIHALQRAVVFTSTDAANAAAPCL